MRTFEHFNALTICPICGTSKDEETVLVPMVGTQEGKICQAVQVHTSCIERSWVYYCGDKDKIIIETPFIVIEAPFLINKYTDGYGKQMLSDAYTHNNATLEK